MLAGQRMDRVKMYMKATWMSAMTDRKYTRFWGW